MMHFTKSAVAGLMLTAVFAVPQLSYAAVVDISHAPKALTLIDNTLNFGAKFGNNNRGNIFADKFTFSLQGDYVAESIVSSISSSASNGLSLTGFDLYGNSGLVARGVQQSTGVKDVWYIPTSSLRAGNYWLQVQGVVNSSTSGSFGGNVNVTPVPEPETWGMMLLGLGAVAAVARRRKTVH